MKISDGFARRPGSLIFGIDEVGNRQTAYQIRGTADRGEYRQAKPASPKTFQGRAYLLLRTVITTATTSPAIKTANTI
jgi:hypothetical protein